MTGALIGERWRVGAELRPGGDLRRIPCRTFQPANRARSGWVKRFTRRAAPGAYLRVIEPGAIRAGDPVEIVHRPDHEVTVALQFRAVTTERALLPSLLAAARPCTRRRCARRGSTWRPRAEAAARAAWRGPSAVRRRPVEGNCAEVGRVLHW